MERAHETVDANTLVRRAEQLIDQGRPGAARPLLRAARGLLEPSATLSLLTARLAMSDARFDAAAVELDRALAADPDHPGLRKCRAVSRQRMGDLDGAARDAAEAVILDRHDPAAKALLGVVLIDLGRGPEAAACLTEAVATAPRDPAHREALARAWIAAGDMDRALAVLHDAIAALPGAVALRNAAILLCVRRRDFVQAVGLAEQSRIDGVADASTFGLKGHALSSLGRHDEAALAYQEARKLAPEDTNVRHLAAAARIGAGGPAAADDFVRTLFDDFAERFDSHLMSLGYRIPGLIRRHVIEFLTEAAIGPVLDLGCGTGLVALALSDLGLGPFTGIDLSPRMLAEAGRKDLYGDLRQARLPDALRAESRTWKLVVAADLLCYFGALDDLFDAVHGCLRPGGRFIFSVEELLPDHDGTIPGNGDWALGRMGRYAHDAAYVARTAAARGFRILTHRHETLRFEAGGPAAGLILVLERPRADA